MKIQLFLIVLIVFMFSCSHSNKPKNVGLIKFISEENTKTIFNRSEFNIDTTSKVFCYVIDYIDAQDNFIVQKTNYYYDTTMNKSQILFYSYAQPQLEASKMSLNIKNKEYTIDIHCDSHVGNSVWAFEKLQEKRVLNTLYLSNPISDTLSNIEGYFNIDYYKNTDFKEKDFTVLFIFSIGR